MKDNLTDNDWATLIDMRKAYLEDRAQTKWSHQRSLELYDYFFGQRIADKWISALELFDLRGGSTKFARWRSQLEGPPQVWDWGCGTGRASRSFFDFVKFPNPVEVVFTDKSSFVTDWAFESLEGDGYKENIRRITTQEIRFESLVLLISHVINELDSSELTRLSDIAAKAEWIFWVESGTKKNSRSLSQVRNKIRHTHEIVGPCLSQGTCEAIDGKPHSHWCHFFANKRQAYFSEPLWNEFSKKLGIDLRSLPYSFFIAKKLAPDSKTQFVHKESSDAVQVGRARIYKGYANTLVCDENAKLNQWTYQKKSNPEFFKSLKKNPEQLLLLRPRSHTE